MLPRVKKGQTSKIIELAENSSLNQNEISKIVGVSRQAVGGCLKRYKIKLQKVDAYRSNRPTILAGFQEKILANLTDDKIADSSVSQAVTSLKTLYEIERLETNKSTSNVAINGVLPEALQSVMDRIMEAE